MPRDEKRIHFKCVLFFMSKPQYITWQKWKKEIHHIDRYLCKYYYIDNHRYEEKNNSGRKIFR